MKISRPSAIFHILLLSAFFCLETILFDQLPSSSCFQPVRREAQKGRRKDTFSWWCFAVCGAFLPYFPRNKPENGPGTLDIRRKTVGVAIINNHLDTLWAVWPFLWLQTSKREHQSFNLNNYAIISERVCGTNFGILGLANIIIIIYH